MAAQRWLHHLHCLAPIPSPNRPTQARGAPAAGTRLGHAIAPLDVGFGRGEWPPEGSHAPIFEPYTLDMEALHRDGYASARSLASQPPPFASDPSCGGPDSSAGHHDCGDKAALEGGLSGGAGAQRPPAARY